jgi:hypothetical protein
MKAASQILLIIENISDKSCIETQNTSYVQLFTENGTVCEIQSKNMIQSEGPHTKMVHELRMRVN